METEKKTLRKWILLILVLLIPITAVLVALRISQAASREKEMNRLKMEMVSELLNNAEDRRKVATDWFLENIEVNLSLMAVALQEFLTEDGYEGPRSFEDGVVIEVRDNEILYPDDKPANRVRARSSTFAPMTETNHQMMSLKTTVSVSTSPRSATASTMSTGPESRSMRNTSAGIQRPRTCSPRWKRL